MIKRVNADINNRKELPSDFYLKDALSLSKNLLGKLIVRELDEGIIISRIVETEAYMGAQDKGCHSYGNKRTKRTLPMYLSGGHAYIYLIYGMYNCFNVVANIEDNPQAVLIRSVSPVQGIEIIKANRRIKSDDPVMLTNGPGKLCQALRIDRELNMAPLFGNNSLYIADDGFKPDGVITAPRVNIDYAGEYKDKPWRFYISGDPFVSVK